jgi:hypothetical protein
LVALLLYSYIEIPKTSNVTIVPNSKQLAKPSQNISRYKGQKIPPDNNGQSILGK